MIDIKALFPINSAPSDPSLKSEGSTPQIERALNSQTAPQTVRAAGHIEVLISVKARLLAAVSAFKSALSGPLGTEFRATSSAPGIASITVTNPAIAHAFSADLTIRHLAKPQILVFRLAAHANPETVLAPTSSPLKIVTGASQQTLQIGSGNDTVKGFVQTLNTQTGLQASVLPTSKGLFIIVKTPPGAVHALEPAAIEAIRRVLRAPSQASTQSLVTALDKIEAKDAMVQLNGKPLGNAAQKMESHFSGYRITVHAAGQARLQSAETVASMHKRVARVMRELNTLVTYLASVAQGEKSGATTPPLAERMMAQAILTRLRKIMTRPIYGLTPAPLMPAELGIQITKAGTIHFDEERFKWMAEHRRDIVTAIFGPTHMPRDGMPEATEAVAPAPGQGVYLLAYDPFSTPAKATLNGLPMRINHDPLGRPVLTLRDDAQDVLIVLTANAPITTDIEYGQSLTDKLDDLTSALLVSDPSVLRADPKTGGPQKEAENDLAHSLSTIASISAQQVSQGDTAQANVINRLPPDMAEFIPYLLYIGILLSNVERHHLKRRRKLKRHGWRRKRSDPS
jgi:hypothetical protein